MNWDAIKEIVVNLYKAVVELLSGLGEWPIDLK